MSAVQSITNDLNPGDRVRYIGNDPLLENAEGVVSLTGAYNDQYLVYWRNSDLEDAIWHKASDLAFDPTIRFGRYMHTSSGKKYWPLDPRADEVDITVIAHHLATKCRYAGAVRHPSRPERIFYSVAEHSVYVALYLLLMGQPLNVVKTGLLHDGSESYNGDLIRPLKYDPEFSAPFKAVEEKNERAIAEKFGIPYPYPPTVKVADEAVTTAEVAQIVPKCPDEEWESGKLHDEAAAAPFKIAMLPPHIAKAMFLELWSRLDTAPHSLSTIGDIADFIDDWDK